MLRSERLSPPLRPLPLRRLRRRSQHRPPLWRWRRARASSPPPPPRAPPSPPPPRAPPRLRRARPRRRRAQRRRRALRPVRRVRRCSRWRVRSRASQSAASPPATPSQGSSPTDAPAPTPRQSKRPGARRVRLCSASVREPGCSRARAAGRTTADSRPVDAAEQIAPPESADPSSASSAHPSSRWRPCRSTVRTPWLQRGAPAARVAAPSPLSPSLSASAARSLRSARSPTTWPRTGSHRPPSSRTIVGGS